MYRLIDKNGRSVFVDFSVDAKELLKTGEYIDYYQVDKVNPEIKINNVIYKEIKVEGENKFDLCLCISKNLSINKPKRDSDFLTILGTSESLKDDIQSYGIYGDIAVVNDCGFYYPNFKHLISIHGALLPLIKQYRLLYRQYENNDFYTHTAIYSDAGFPIEQQNKADYIWKFRPLYRSSGLFAIWVGIALGYKTILVHGINLDPRNHFYDIEQSKVFKQFDKLFNQVNNDLLINLIKSSNVRVSSGRFSEIIGKPTKKWINGNKPL